MPSKSVRKKIRLSDGDSGFYSPAAMKPIGILGGGQLARMLALEAHRLGLPVRILSAAANDPAATVAPWTQGDLSADAALRAFLRECSVVTFESEFLDAAQLGRLSNDVGTPIYPQPATMGLLQDRLTQKQLLVKHGLPTAEFVEVDDAREAWQSLGRAAVFKKRRFGYDGYGTFVARDEKGLRAAEAAMKTGDGFIAERFVPFKRELAVMLARSRSGAVRVLPFVETFQENSRCLWVRGPVASAALSRLSRRLVAFLDAIDYVGAIGVELFETREGLVINELAPRVHNSGHYSMDALTASQFALHLAAVAGLELPSPRLISKGFAMWNLLGSSSHAPSLTCPDGAWLHWYGKHENRPGRKMGHLNVIADTPKRAWTNAQKIRSTIKV